MSRSLAVVDQLLRSTRHPAAQGARRGRFRVACRRAIGYDRELNEYSLSGAAMTESNRVAIVRGLRTPFVKSSTLFARLDPLDLGKAVVTELLQRTEIDPKEVQEIVFGIVIPMVKAANLAREIVLATGLPRTIPGHTVSRACASSNTALTTGADMIHRGYADTVVIGGAESLSTVPILFSRRFAEILVAASKAKTLAARLGLFSKLRPRDLAPDPPAIAEKSTGLTMGQSAELMAKANGISREAQDKFAHQSHIRAARAWDEGRFADEVMSLPVPPAFDVVAERDNLVRPDTTYEALSKLKPVFDRKFGTITAGNASPLTDGASAILLMSEAKAKANGFKPIGYLRSYAYAALDPFDQLLQGPVFAIPIALERAGLTLKDIGVIEMHEAFAAQVLSNIQWLGSKKIAVEKLGRTEPVGDIDPEKINLTGGSIAIGHPFGATGARIVTTVCNELQRTGEQFGLVSVCAAGAQGSAIVVERD
jgi:acetyl-CoA acyltransferase